MREIGRVVVIGAGTMGHGIAQVAAMAGHPTTLVDTSEERARQGLQRIRQNLDAGVERDKVTSGERDEALEQLATGTDLRSTAEAADLVVEAVPERFQLKADIFRTLDEAAPEHALLASNTSSISITSLQEVTSRPERVLGLHFFNPVHILALVEVVRGARTAEGTMERATEFVRQLEKEPIIVRDSPGFASSRLGVALGLEAMRMVEEEVASPADIDRAMVLGYRHPMGPLRLTDLIGLDVRLNIAEYLHTELEADRFRPPEILSRMVAEGKLGRKTGEGFYRWDQE